MKLMGLFILILLGVVISLLIMWLIIDMDSYKFKRQEIKRKELEKLKRYINYK